MKKCNVVDMKGNDAIFTAKVSSDLNSIEISALVESGALDPFVINGGEDVCGCFERLLDEKRIEPCMCGWKISCEPQDALAKWDRQELGAGETFIVSYWQSCGPLFDD